MTRKHDDELLAVSQSLRSLVRSLKLSERNYDVATSHAKMLRQVLHEELASEFAHVLNERIKTAQAQCETHDQRRQLAMWVNAELDLLGLSIVHPDTGKPGTLVADCDSVAQREQSSRFRIVDRGSDHRRVSGVMHAVPLLELMPDPPRGAGRHRGFSR